MRVYVHGPDSTYITHSMSGTERMHQGFGPIRLDDEGPLATFRITAGVIQLVECQLPKLDVAGSSPVARSQLISILCG